MTQFIAHATAPRTFADKKGATKAIKRDLNAHFEKHGDVLFNTGFEVKPTDGDRFGVVLFLDLTPTNAQKLVGKELEGYVIEPALKEDPAKIEPAAPVEAKPEPKAKSSKEPAKGSRRKGQITVEPSVPLLACRAGSKQQAIIETLAREGGATLEDLRKVCLKSDGTPWDDNSIRSAMYFDLELKGYGTTTRFENDVAIYTLVLPEGYTTFLPPKVKS